MQTDDLQLITVFCFSFASFLSNSCASGLSFQVILFDRESVVERLFSRGMKNEGDETLMKGEKPHFHS